MQLLDYEQVILYQMELLRQQGASLSYFAVTYQKQDLFILSNINKLPNFSSYNISNVITVKDHTDSNLMTISIAFLKSIFQRNNNSLLQHIKCSLYTKDLTFSQLPMGKRHNLSDKEIKKIFVQFFQLLTYVDEENKVVTNLKKYSIILTLFTLYFRVILFSLNMGEALDTQQRLATNKIYLVLLDFFDISYREFSGTYLFLDDYIFMSITNSQYFVGNYTEKKRNKSSIYRENLLAIDSNWKKLRRSSKDISEGEDQDLDPQIASLKSSTPSFVKINPQDYHFAKKQIRQTSQTNRNQQQKKQSLSPSFCQKISVQQKISLSNIGIRQVQQFQITTSTNNRKKSVSLHHISYKNINTPNFNPNKLEVSATYSFNSKKRQINNGMNAKQKKQSRVKFLENLQKEIKKAKEKNIIKYAFTKKLECAVQQTDSVKHRKWSPIAYNRNKNAKTSQICQKVSNPFAKYENIPSTTKVPKFIRDKKKIPQQNSFYKPSLNNMDEDLNSFYSTQSFLLGQQPNSFSKSFGQSSDDYNVNSLRNSNQQYQHQPKRLVKTSAIYFRDNWNLNKQEVKSPKDRTPPKITFSYNKQQGLPPSQRHKINNYSNANINKV